MIKDLELNENKKLDKNVVEVEIIFDEVKCKDKINIEDEEVVGSFKG